MSLEINRPCYEVDFTSKLVSEQLMILSYQRLNSAVKKQAKEALKYEVISSNRTLRL